MPNTPFFSGYEGTGRLLQSSTGIVENEWYIEKRNYMLTRVRMYGVRTETASGTLIETSGFEVTY